MKKHLSEGQKEIVQHAIDGIEEILSEDIENPAEVWPVEDLHHRLFNEDYFIIGYYAAEQFLIRWGGVFLAIGDVKEYDEARYGQVYTDLSSSEAVANKIAYIDGEKFLWDCPSYSNKQGDATLYSVEDLQNIIQELKSL